MYENVLAVDPGRIVERQVRLGHPPAVSVVRRGREARRVVSVDECPRPISSAADRVIDPGSGHDLPVLLPARLQVVPLPARLQVVPLPARLQVVPRPARLQMALRPARLQVELTEPG